MKAVIFDLDDTLYDELTYVRSGFYAVAHHLKEKYCLDPDEVFFYMWQWMELNGRGKVFDQALSYFGIFTKKEVKQCIAVYRQHQPNIVLSEAGERCLERLKDYPLYIVTDGNKLVQHKKLLALGLYDRVKHCFITHRYGIKHAKPSPYCFEKILEMEKCLPNEAVYIGDNPLKDFVGIKPLGLKTIRLMQGQYKHITVDPDYDADFKINSLDELTEDMLFQIN